MTLVLLHSAGATASVWDPVLPFLTGVDVLVPTLPGRPGGEEAATDMAGCARAVLGAMDAAGLERATVTGHSLGGAVALWMALSSPTRVAGLGLISTGARLRVLPRALEALQDGLRGVIDGLVNAQFGPAASDRDRVARRRQFESVGAETTLADLRACDGFDVMDRLWEVRCRTQVLVGSEDVLTPPAYSRLLADRISAGRLTEYPGAGHMLLWERPAEVAGELAVLWAATADRRPAGAAGDGDGGAGAKPISAREAPRT